MVLGLVLGSISNLRFRFHYSNQADSLNLATANKGGMYSILGASIQPDSNGILAVGLLSQFYLRARFVPSYVYHA
jgi:hypothetical protein